MGIRDTRVDAYIAKSPAFARPILRHLRDVVHEGCPGVEETMKWSVPHFDYRGVLCSMAAFKEYCGFAFWKASLVLGEAARDGAAGHFGRIASVEDLPSRKVLVGYVTKAAKLNEEGVKPAKRAQKPKQAIAEPAWFTAALAKNRKARAAYGRFTPGQQREYLAWLTEAKTDATRQRRLETALEWIAEGKPRHWRYQ